VYAVEKRKNPIFFWGEELIINLFGWARQFFGIKAFPGVLWSCQGADFEDHVPIEGNRNAAGLPATTFQYVKNRPAYEPANEKSLFCILPHHSRSLSQIPV